MHKKRSLPVYSFPHLRDWLAAIDQTSSDKLPAHLLQEAVHLKKYLLETMQQEIFLHGDLHHDNVLQHRDEWIAIDPKGIIGEVEFEMAAFDFIHHAEYEQNNVRDVFFARIKLLSEKAGVDAERLKNWVFVRLILSAVWSIEDNDDPHWAISLAELLL